MLYKVETNLLLPMSRLIAKTNTFPKKTVYEGNDLTLNTTMNVMCLV